MFGSREDMEDAVNNVDGTEMRNMRGSCVVKVQAMRDSGDRRDDDRRDDRGDPRGRSRSRCECRAVAVRATCGPAMVPSYVLPLFTVSPCSAALWVVGLFCAVR